MPRLINGLPLRILEYGRWQRACRRAQPSLQSLTQHQRNNGVAIMIEMCRCATRVVDKCRPPVHQAWEVIVQRECLHSVMLCNWLKDFVACSQARGFAPTGSGATNVQNDWHNAGVKPPKEPLHRRSRAKVRQVHHRMWNEDALLAIVMLLLLLLLGRCPGNSLVTRELDDEHVDLCHIQHLVEPERSADHARGTFSLVGDMNIGDLFQQARIDITRGSAPGRDGTTYNTDAMVTLGG